MTTELWIKVWQSLVMGFVFLIPFAFCRLADIGFGAVLASKLDNLTFDKQKLFKGIVYTIFTLLSLACLIAGITMIPILLEYYNITNTDALKDAVDVTLIISTVVVSSVTYGKDAYEKFKTLLEKKAISTIVLDDTVDEAADGE
mgnify:CR=1 FL=1